MIGLSTQLFDLDGFDVFKSNEVTELNTKVERRVSTTPTLDGGSYVSDQGYSDSDKTFNFKVRYLSKSRFDNLVQIAKLHSRVYLCTSEGAFECVIKQIYKDNKGDTNFNIIVVGGA